MSKILEVNEINVFYDKIHAIKDISFYIKEGEIVSFIGANGAGKTTILNAISNILPIKSGEVVLNGESINNVKAHKLVPMGMAHVPEGRRIFTDLTVMENLEIGAYTRSKNEFQEELKKVFDLFPRLKERKNQLSGTMSGGEQQMLAIGRALMSKPKLLLLDEPSMGLSPLLVKEIFEIIKRINKEGNTTILLVEQNAKKSLEISDRAYVIEVGKIVLEGKGSEIANNDIIKKVYLGG